MNGEPNNPIAEYVQSLIKQRGDYAEFVSENILEVIVDDWSTVIAFTAPEIVA